MGAVNYRTSDYVTLGVNIDRLEEMNTTHYNGREEVDELSLDIDLQTIREDIEAELEGHDFWYFHITIEPGYYEGFSIDIENNFFAYNSYEDKREAQKEITEIKSFLLRCVDLGLVVCYPGWCTGYEDEAGSRKEIRKAVKRMREEVKSTPTLSQYERA